MSGQFQPEKQISSAFLRNPSYTTATINERNILDMALKQGVVTRPEITEATGLTKQSISRLVTDLLNRGLIRTGKKIGGNVGKPSTELELVPDATYSIGFSVMADAVSLALLNFKGELVASNTISMADMSFEKAVRWMETNLKRLCRKHHIDLKQIFGIGLAVSGFFISGTQQFNTPKGLDDWAMRDLDREISARFELPVWVENDGNAAAIGESMLGVGRWAQNYAYLFFTNGFGGGMVIDGKPMRGAHGNAGEMSLLLKAVGMPKPDLESLRKTLSDHGVEYENVADMIANYDPAWPGLDSWIEKMAPSLCLLASSIFALNDPEAIVLGGRIPRDLAKKLLPHIKVTNASRRNRPGQLPEITVAEVNIDASAVGAAMLPLKRHFFL